MSLRNRLKRQLRNRQFRHAYADEQLNLSISTQIKVIRERQKMSQAALAEKIGTKQAGISRIESANYEGWSIATLRKLADVFDLRLRVSFEEFGTLWQEVDNFNRQSLQRREFDADPEFKEVEESELVRAAATLEKASQSLASAFIGIGAVPELSRSISAALEPFSRLDAATKGLVSMVDSMSTNWTAFDKAFLSIPNFSAIQTEQFSALSGLLTSRFLDALPRDFATESQAAMNPSAEVSLDAVAKEAIEPDLAPKRQTSKAYNPSFQAAA